MVQSVNCHQNVNPLDTAKRQVASEQRKSQDKDPEPNPQSQSFPDVTDLFFRLPLPTLFCGPEAANLGDLLRLWVRSGVRIILAFGFSGAVGSASDTSNDKVLYQPIHPIARQSDFRENVV